MAKGFNGLVELSSFYAALDDEFKTQLEQEVNGASLFNLLKLPKLDPFYEFYNCILEYYNAEENVFEFGDHRLTVTLEDVLYITGLPIRGNAVICEKSRDHEAFLRVFNIDYPNRRYKKMPLEKLKEFAIDVNNDLVRRKIVALLVVQSCIITPSFMGHGIASMYVQLLEELDKVESYAWGAALLSFLYSGLERWCNGMKAINGNLWVLLSFFLIRIPKLREAFGVDLTLTGYKGPLLHHVMDRIKNRCFNHGSNYVPQMADILKNLSDDDITWRPYLPSMLPARVEGQAEWGTLLVPLFCNNYVVYHMPHLVAKQFNVFEKYHVSEIKWKALKIKTMENKGPRQDFVKFYEVHLRTWAEQKRAQDYMPRINLIETETPGPSRARDHMSSTIATEHRIRAGCGRTMSTTTTDGKVYNAFSAMKRLGLREENVKLVLLRLLKLYDKNWQLIEEDNYRTLVDAIFEYEKDKNAEREMEPPRKKRQTGIGVGKALSKYKGKSIVREKESDSDTCDSGNSPQSANSSDICSGSSNPSCDEAVVAAKSARKKVFHRIEDITKGTEEVQISLVDEIGNEDLPRFVYFPHSVSFQSAQVRVSLSRIADEDCCSDCKGDCLSSSAPCECAGSTGGEYAYTTEGLLTRSFLQKCVAKNFIKECWKKCGCDMKCGNRVVQRGITRKLQVFLTSEGKGWGLRALEALPQGAFVCEYVGEILTNVELRERNRRSRADKEKHTYRVLLDDWSTQENLNDNDALCLDATNCGNVARFLNHRCADANLVDIPVQVETPDRHYYHVALFTKRRVDALEELNWDYGIEFWDNGRRIKRAFECRCGSRDCRDVRPRT